MTARLARTSLRRRASAFVMVMVAVSAACTSGGDEDVAPTTSVGNTTTTLATPRDDDGVLLLGVYLPRTGEGAPLGEPMIEAVQQAVDRINAAGGVLGGDVEVDVVDEGAGTGPDELLALGVDAIIGPASSRVALSQLSTAVRPQTGVVVCSPTATALALDDFPDGGFFFRTAPSDSLQMAAIARQAQRTGVISVAVGFLDDPYGRGLADAFVAEAEQRGLEVRAEVGFSGDEENLTTFARRLLEPSPGVVVVLGDADDGSRLLAALDAAAPDAPPRVIVNDAIREARQTIQSLSEEFRARLVGVAPRARSILSDGPPGFFTAHATDCVNLIALAAVVADSDAPTRLRGNIASIGSGGRVCGSFEACADLHEQGLLIDYNGASGGVELSNSTGDPIRAWFESFGFGDDGVELEPQPFEVSASDQG